MELLKPRGVTQGDVPRVLHPQLCPSPRAMRANLFWAELSLPLLSLPIAA